MKKNRLGSTDIEVSQLGLGTVKLGRNEGVKYPQGFMLPDDKAADQLIGTAADLGINLIDTAPAYGSSEERLGKLLRERRKQWVICSKVGEEFSDGLSTFDFSEAHTRSSIDRSLQRLRTDFIDIVLVHSDGNDRAIIEESGILSTLADIRKQGKIRSFGMSTKTIEGGLLAASLSDVVMVTYNPGHREEEPVLDYCRDHNKGCLIKKAFASGHFSNNDKGSDKDTDPVRASIDFVFAHQGVTSAIIGTINIAHLRHNVACLASH